MRARICSAISCDMFARVVWLRLWAAQNRRFSPCHLYRRTCHAWLARLTRARGWSFLRGRKALLNDFWYFWSYKSTIKRNFLYVSSRANNVRPYAQNPSIANRQSKNQSHIRFFFCIYRRKRKSYQKENAGRRFRTLRSATRALPFEPASL